MQKFSDIRHRREIAYVMINCESGYEFSVLEEIKHLAGIREIECTIGNYDIILKIEADSIEQLRELIVMKIRNILRILTTTTLLCTEQPTPMLMQNIQ